MPTAQARQDLAREARRIKARDANLTSTRRAGFRFGLIDRMIFNLMRDGADPEDLKEWLTQAVDLYDLATPASTNDTDRDDQARAAGLGS